MIPALLGPTPAAALENDDTVAVAVAVPREAPVVAVTVQSGTATARTVLLPTSAASLKGESEGREEEGRERRVKDGEESEGDGGGSRVKERVESEGESERREWRVKV